MKKQQGFNLIELLVVIAIIGLIAAIAYPSYQEQVRKTRRADCSGALASFGNAMERFFTVNGTYVGAGPTVPGAPAIFPTTCPIDGGAATYDLTIQAATASTFTIHAAPTGVQTGDKCGTLTLNNRGVKGVTGMDAGVTWQKCW